MNNEKPDYSLCPSCPEIKKKIDRIDLALLGEDGTGLNGGIVKAITDLQKEEQCFGELGKFCKTHRHRCCHVDCYLSINLRFSSLI